MSKREWGVILALTFCAFESLRVRRGESGDPPLFRVVRRLSHGRGHVPCAQGGAKQVASSRERSAIANRVAELAAPLAESLGLELVEVSFESQGGSRTLRVSIDKPGGVSLPDCQALSEGLSRTLDETDPVSGPYHLEVSSPGPERPLVSDRDYERFAGEAVRIELEAPKGSAGRPARHTWQGRLVGLQEGNVVIEAGKEEVKIPLAAIRRARLVDRFAKQ